MMPLAGATLTEDYPKIIFGATGEKYGTPNKISRRIILFLRGTLQGDKVIFPLTHLAHSHSRQINHGRLPTSASPRHHTHQQL